MVWGRCSMSQLSLFTLLPSTWCAAVAVPQRKPSGKFLSMLRSPPSLSGRSPGARPRACTVQVSARSNLSGPAISILMPCGPRAIDREPEWLSRRACLIVAILTELLARGEDIRAVELQKAVHVPADIDGARRASH